MDPAVKPRGDISDFSTVSKTVSKEGFIFRFGLFIFCCVLSDQLLYKNIKYVILLEGLIIMKSIPLFFIAFITSLLLSQGILAQTQTSSADGRKAALERRKAALEKLKELKKMRPDLRKVDKPITPTDQDKACEKDVEDPQYQKCHELKESECQASKVCFWDTNKSTPRCVSAKPDECVAIDIGCCRGEKRAAVNKKAADALEKTREKDCDALLKLPENSRMCRGRTMYKRQDERPTCRKKVCELY